MFELTKTISLFIYPLGAFFLLVLFAQAARVFGRSRMALRMAVFSLVWLWVWSMPVTSEWMRRHLEAPYANLPADQAPMADAIVVLGGAFQSDAAWPYPSAGGAVDRYWHGARLYLAGRAPLIILSGGRHPQRPQNPSEAESGAGFLIDMGVPATSLLLVHQSRTTHEHIRYITPILVEHDIERLLLVTSAAHMRRAESLFQRTELDVVPVATDFSVAGHHPPALST